MIYLLETTYYNKRNKEILDLLKIGYTKDENLKSRLVQYKLHNPMYELLFTIPEVDESVEKAIHLYFQEFQFSDYGKEWFVYNEEIIDFFKTHTTPESILECPEVKESIEKLTIISNQRKLARVRFNLLDAIDRLLRVYSESNSIEDTLSFQITLHSAIPFENYESIQNIDPYDYLKTQCDLVTDSLIESAKNYIQPEVDDDKLLDIINQFNDIGIWAEQMKFLCGQKSKLTDSEFSIILDLVPTDFKNYLTLFTVSQIGTCKYQRATLEKEFDRLIGVRINKDKVKSKVLDFFKIGERYTKAYIKSELGKIYEECNYGLTAKATDLKQWFVLKPTQITNPITKKRDPGFEIISKKL